MKHAPYLYVLTIHTVFNELVGIVGPFTSKRHAFDWRRTYTEHEAHTVEVHTLLRPQATVRREGLGRKAITKT
jgi:hypothetical protein